MLNLIIEVSQYVMILLLKALIYMGVFADF